MEENTTEVTTEEVAEEIIEGTTETSVEEVVIEKLEPLPYNREERYIPTEFQLIDYANSWKKCHCGRQTWINDNYCPRCGQRLGRPNMDD